MSTRARSVAWLLLGGLAVCGSFVLPSHIRSSASLACLSAVAPAQRLLARAGRSVSFALDRALPGRSARESGDRPSAARLAEELARERARSREYERRLRNLAAFARARKSLTACRPEPVAEAEVIGRGAGPHGAVVFIDRGTRHGVEEGMVALEGRSVVGTVRAAAPSVSAVLLGTSIGSRFAGLLVPAGDAAARAERGIVVGRGDGTMKMKYVTRRRPRVGDQVVTQGRDGLIPKQLLLGCVTRVSREPGRLTYDVTIESIRDFERLVTVIVARPAVTAGQFPEVHRSEKEAR
ncbi:MAG: rod shape-determining protein MreC [Planctomycetota bacterium]